MKLPNIDAGTFYKVGVFCFATVSVCNLVLLYQNWAVSNWWSRTSSMAMLLFNIVLTLFFYGLLKMPMPQMAVEPGELSQEEIIQAFEEGKGDVP